MKVFQIFKRWFVMSGFIVLVGCAPLQTPPGAVGDVLGTATVLTATAPPTALPTTAAITATPEEKPMKTITLEPRNQTISMHVGESFLLNLGGDIYSWSDISLDPQGVISRRINVTVIRGAQGIYLAQQPGKVTLTISGDPLCRQSKPACGMPSILFTLQVEVTQ